MLFNEIQRKLKISSSLNFYEWNVSACLYFIKEVVISFTGYWILSSGIAKALD